MGKMGLTSWTVIWLWHSENRPVCDVAENVYPELHLSNLILLFCYDLFSIKNHLYVPSRSYMMVCKDLSPFHQELGLFGYLD